MKDGVRLFPFEKTKIGKCWNLVVLVIGISTIILVVQFNYVNSSWTEWGPWSDCGISCGEGGFSSRSRFCTGDFSDCPGQSFEGQVCNLPPCPINGVWFEWSAWTNCTEVCGGGEIFRERDCQEPMYGGTPCEGDYNQTVACNTDPCPVDGNWTQWGDWQTCSVSCGGGMQYRNRTCIGPFHGGLPCEGEDHQERDCNLDPCPIDGAWTEWVEWSECSTTCNIGQEKRFRSCTNPSPDHGGRDCSGRHKQTRFCYPKVCPVHGSWSLWSEWTECSQTCDWGIRQRFRLCDNPKPNFGGSYCVGSATAGESCITEPCPVNAQWGPWSAWVNCSKTCGSGGKSYRSRLCNMPPALYGGLDCEGIASYMVDCYVDRCENDGGWSEWSEWGQCSKDCETGTQSRNRTCDNPPTPPDGEECRGDNEESRTCNIHICPVHGGWTPWSPWTKCPVTCGGDIETRFRSCTNPPPLFLGNPCDGLPNEERDCSTDGCPVDGAWTEWSSWTQCSVSCGGGTTSIERTCTNPAPAWGGDPCPETDEYEKWQDCNMFPCPIHGGWSQWSNFTACPVTCGGFTLLRNRTCDDPAPLYGGDICPGEEVDSTVCNDNPCPVNGSWSTWSEWDECSVPCEGGIQFRTRTCSDPAPAYGGFRCPGVDEGVDPQTEVMNQTCNEQMCPIHGGWTQWTDWPDCPVTCGGASILRFRNCTNPVPKYGGDYCSGSNVSEIICNGDVQCPIHGNWGRWVNWGPCSKSCEGGIRTRIRLCNNPSPLYGGRQCNGSVLEEDICNDIQCPVHGGFSQWTSWTECSRTCGGGQTERTRECNSPEPQFGGNPCYGVHIEKRLCAAFYCPVHGGYSDWGLWSECTVTCGGALIYRTRSCNNPTPKHDGLPCEGPPVNSTLCNTNPCPIDGAWTQWTSWSRCSVTCDDGIQASHRECMDPEPQYGGDPCVGESNLFVYCSDQDHCPMILHAPDNLTISVEKKDEVDVYINWEQPSEADTPDYYILEVRPVYTPEVPASNVTFYRWRTVGTVLGTHTRLILREQSWLFQFEFAARLTAGNLQGQAVSQEHQFDVMKYISSAPAAFATIWLIGTLCSVLYVYYIAS